MLLLLHLLGLYIQLYPSALFLLGAFLLYGALFSFEPLSWLFWLIQAMFVILLLVADYLANLYGIKKYGGSKAGVWGSTIGILVGPFVIPVFGILIGPFIGAVIGEMIVNRSNFTSALKIGLGSVVGFISGVITKAIIQLLMVAYFLFLVL